jgi:hypothetical protein
MDDMVTCQTGNSLLVFNWSLTDRGLLSRLQLLRSHRSVTPRLKSEEGKKLFKMAGNSAS